MHQLDTHPLIKIIKQDLNERLIKTELLIAEAKLTIMLFLPSLLENSGNVTFCFLLSKSRSTSTPVTVRTCT